MGYADVSTPNGGDSDEDTNLPTIDAMTNSSYVDVSAPNRGDSDEEPHLPSSDVDGAADAGFAPGQLPPLERLRDIAYGALPCREHACSDAGHVTEDMLQTSYMGQWGASG